MLSTKSTLTIYCDGGSRGNPGPAASAFVVTQRDSVIFKGSKFLGNETNNVAEYNAVMLAVEWLSNQKLEEKSEVTINLDSQLVERQLNGFYKIKNEKLRSFFEKISSKIASCQIKPKFVWNYRDHNELADTLVNEELDNNS